MSMNTLEYFPQYEEVEVKIQARVRASLAKKINRLRESRKLTWNELVSGLFEKLADDANEFKTTKDPEQFDFLSRTG